MKLCMTERRSISTTNMTNDFIISHVGEKYDPAFQDLGVEYYKYLS